VRSGSASSARNVPCLVTLPRAARRRHVRAATPSTPSVHSKVPRSRPPTVLAGRPASAAARIWKPLVRRRRIPRCACRGSARPFPDINRRAAFARKGPRVEHHVDGAALGARPVKRGRPSSRGTAPSLGCGSMHLALQSHDARHAVSLVRTLASATTRARRLARVGPKKKRNAASRLISVVGPPCHVTVHVPVPSR